MGWYELLGVVWIGAVVIMALGVLERHTACVICGAISGCSCYE